MNDTFLFDKNVARSFFPGYGFDAEIPPSFKDISP